jgi:hypothetical protein
MSWNQCKAHVGLWSHNLWRNLLAGTRLAFGLPVPAHAFRVSFVDLIWLTLIDWIGIVISAAYQDPGEVFNPQSLIGFFAQMTLALGAAAWIAMVYRRQALALALMVAWTASDPFFQVIMAATSWIGFPLLDAYAWIVFLLWMLLAALRAVWLLAGARGTRRRPFYWSIGIVLLLLVLQVGVMPRQPVWLNAPEETEATRSPLHTEHVFHLQGALLERTMQSIASGTRGRTELFFVGFAPDGSQPMFFDELQAVQAILSARFQVAQRAVILSNDPRVVQTHPLASATNLRRTLTQVRERMNNDEDVLLLYIAGQADPSYLLPAVAPGLALQPINPTLVARALQDAGIRWKIIVVSSCYAGGFIEPLKDEHTLILTSAAADQLSLGCMTNDPWTAFGAPLFNEGLAKSTSLLTAFTQARESIAAAERAADLPASSPQLFIGAAMEKKLKALEAKK